MDNNKKPDLIESVCGGAGKEYSGPCIYYEKTTHCLLLKTGRIIEIWKNSRCISYQILNAAIRKKLSQCKKNYPWLIIDDDFAEDIDFEKIINSIAKAVSKKPLNPPNLAVWTKYLRRTASNYVYNHLVPQYQCGFCRYLSASGICESKAFVIAEKSEENPYYGEKRNKTDKSCNGYSPGIPEFLSGDEKQDDENESAFEKYIAESYGCVADQNDIESSVIQKDIHYKRLLLLKERAEKENKIKKRMVFMRQYSIYKRLYCLLEEGHTVKEAKRLLITEYKISRNMLNRDLTEIREYFEKNDSK